MTGEKDNNRRQKYSGFRHFWDYYRWHCVIVCLLLIAVGFIFKDLTNRKKNDMSITIISAFTYDNEVCEEQIKTLEDIIRKDSDFKDLSLGYSFILLPETVEGQKSYQGSVYLSRLIIEISEGKNCIFLMDGNAKEVLETYQKDYFSVICELPEQYTASEISQKLMIGLKAPEQSRCDIAAYEKEKNCYLVLYRCFSSE